MTITYPRDWPSDIPFVKSRFGLSPNQASFPSALSRKIVTQSHAGGVTDRWEGVLTTGILSAAQHANLRALFLSLDGLSQTVNLFDPDHREPVTGLKPGGGVTNWLKQSEDILASPWLTQNSPTILTNVDGTADSIEDDSASAFEFIDQIIAIPDDDATYTISFRVKKEATSLIFGTSYTITDGPGTGVFHTGRFDAKTGDISTSSGNATITDEATYWRISAQVSNNNSGHHELLVRLFPATRATLNGSDDVAQTGTITVKEFQVERAATVGAYEATTTGILVNGASQTGTSINLDGFAGAVAFAAGDYFQIGSQYFMCIEAVSASAGAATVNFRPAIRTAFADNTPVNIIRPVLAARLIDPETFWELDETGLGSFSFAFEEAL